VAASHHGDTPHSGKPVTSVPVTPYTTSVDVNRAPIPPFRPSAQVPLGIEPPATDISGSFSTTALTVLEPSTAQEAILRATPDSGDRRNRR
jgi:hypothetical protein